jgi:hypothetical protein
MTSMKSMRRKWFLAPLLVGALAVGLVGGGSVFAQVFAQTEAQDAFNQARRPHDEQHERPSDGAAWQHDEQHERP